MKKVIALVLALVCVLGLVGCSNSAEETIPFHEKTFNKSELSAETLEWLEKYNELSKDEQLAISYIPSDLYELCGYGNGIEGIATTEVE